MSCQKFLQQDKMKKKKKRLLMAQFFSKKKHVQNNKLVNSNLLKINSEDTPTLKVAAASAATS